jgi:hypothetical protein
VLDLAPRWHGMSGLTNSSHLVRRQESSPPHKRFCPMLQIVFPQPVQLHYVEVGLDGATSNALPSASHVCLYANNLATATASHFQPLSSDPVAAPRGQLHRHQITGGILTDRLVVRGLFQTLIVRCVGVSLSTSWPCLLLPGMAAAHRALMG